MTEHERFDDVELLHPVMIPKVKIALHYIKSRKLPFRIFETWRSPIRQNFVKSQGNSQLPAWSSTHAFGLAVDFVPYIDGKWTWEVDAGLWTEMHQAIKPSGLVFPIRWDLPHAEHPKASHWVSEIRKMMK